MKRIQIRREAGNNTNKNKFKQKKLLTWQQNASNE